METIIISGVTLVLTEETAKEVRTELEREHAARRDHWMLWHWYARRWAMYGNRDEDGSLFSDLYKDETGCRPHISREEVFWLLYGRECWIEHGPHCTEYRRAKARGWR